MTDKVKHIQALDGLRGIAALCVMIHHYTGPSSIPLFNNAPLAVDIFFVLSGYVLAHSYKDLRDGQISSETYLKRRFIRLYPIFLLGLLLGAISIFWTSIVSATSIAGPTFQSLSYNIFMLPFPETHASANIFGLHPIEVGETFPLNPPLWSLPFELFASILFIFLIRLRLKGLAIATGLSALLYILAALCFGTQEGNQILDFRLGFHPTTLVYGLPRTTFGFCMGMLICTLFNEENAVKRIKERFQIWPTTSLLLIFAIGIFMFPYQFDGLFPLLAIFVLAPILITLLLMSDKPLAREVKILGLLGYISYPLYALHYPLGQMVFALFPASQREQLAPLLTALVVAVLASYAVAKLFDGPVNRYLRKKWLA